MNAQLKNLTLAFAFMISSSTAFASRPTPPSVPSENGGQPVCADIAGIWVNEEKTEARCKYAATIVINQIACDRFTIMFAYKQADHNVNAIAMTALNYVVGGRTYSSQHVPNPKHGDVLLRARTYATWSNDMALLTTERVMDGYQTKNGVRQPIPRLTQRLVIEPRDGRILANGCLMVRKPVDQ